MDKELQRLYRYLVNYKLEHDGNSPSYREIQAACGISSSSMVAYKLGRLRRLGLIDWPANKPVRNIIIIGGAWRPPAEDERPRHGCILGEVHLDQIDPNPYQPREREGPEHE
jgi:hypothetical protein